MVLSVNPSLDFDIVLTGGGTSIDGAASSSLPVTDLSSETHVELI